ncbi:MAG: NUDIX domain-containing protein [Flavobacteriales bacterium]|nr:NUDIX domain-containing protein [Flavobacteriales bacterium]
MYTVFIGDNQISFPCHIEDCQGAVIMDPTPDMISGVIQDCNCKGNVKISLFSHDREELIDIFDKKFIKIQAAGGIVRHKTTGRILFIHRGDLWDLPKGWLEDGESVESGAMREVMEETGIKNLEIEGYVYTSRHAYMLKGKWAMKITHWYAMSTDDVELSPQLEEGIDEARWYDREDLDNPLGNTYASIRNTFSHYRKKYMKE